MLKMNNDLEGALKEFISLLNSKKYFEAHEVLEEAWHPLRLKKDPLANLLKGLINGAIALEHLKRNRKNSKDKAKRVLKSFERYRHLATDDIRYSSLFYKACEGVDSLILIML